MPNVVFKMLEQRCNSTTEQKISRIPSNSHIYEVRKRVGLKGEQRDHVNLFTNMPSMSARRRVI